MNNKSVLITAVVVFVFGSAVYGQPWAGSGDANDPYQIWTAEDMQAIGASPGYWDAHFNLMADINLSAYTGTSFNIIGEIFMESPYGIALDTTGGKMYWVEGGTEKIYRANLDGTGIEPLVTIGLDSPVDIALDLASGKMYWTDCGTDKIQRASLDGTEIEDLVTAELDSPYGIALDLAGGKMYWTDIGTNKIQRANLDGTSIEDLIVVVVSPHDVALDLAGGKIYWTDISTDKIQRANLDGTEIEDLVTESPGALRGIALDLAGGKMYWTDYQKIQRANLDGTGIEGLVTTGISYGLYGIALNINNGKMYWTDSYAHKINVSNLDGTNIFDVLRNGFRGVFDGNDHTISNFTYDSNGVDYVGLFGYIYGPNTEVKNLGLIDPNIHTNLEFSYTGSLAGYLDRGTIGDCYVEGGYVRGGSCGCLVGRIRRGTVTDCYVEAGSVSGTSSVGGLIGVNGGGVSGCYSTGSVTGNSGGLVGGNEGNIVNSYSLGSVTGGAFAGGLVYRNGGYIEDCYSAGIVEGAAYIGGLVALRGCTGGTVNSFWDVNSSGVEMSDGGIGLTTEEMQTESTFMDAGWDFVTPVWKICKEPDYPKLWWEGCPLEVEVKLTPHMLNCESKGKWVKAHVVLPEGYWPEDIDVNTPAVAEPMGVESEYIKVFDNGKGKFGVEIGFDREAFCAAGLESEDGYLDVTVTGWLLTSEQFEGTDTIKVISRRWRRRERTATIRRGVREIR